jgi:hypothetical protein
MKLYRCEPPTEETTGLTLLRMDETTYTQDPMDLSAFEAFEFDYIAKLSEIADLLAIPSIQDFHEKLGILYRSFSCLSEP